MPRRGPGPSPGPSPGPGPSKGRGRGPGPSPGPGPSGAARRGQRRKRRRRIAVAGGALLLVGGSYKKFKSQDVEKVEAHTGQSADDMSEEQLAAAVAELGIEEQPLDESDKALIEQEEAEAEG